MQYGDAIKTIIITRVRTLPTYTTHLYICTITAKFQQNANKKKKKNHLTGMITGGSNVMLVYV